MRNHSRPVRKMQHTPLETLLGVLTMLGLIADIAVTAWGWVTLPATIPTHYDLSGSPNAYGGKESLLILAILSVCLAALLTFLSRFPHRYNYAWPITPENAPSQYALARLLLLSLALEIVWMLCGLEWILIQAAQSLHMGDALLLLIVAMVLTLIVTIILYLLAAARAR
jgi:uncharacterized membrane protein